MSVPLYSSDLALLDFISDKRALRLEDCGLAKVVRHKGHINRVVFYRRPDDPLPSTARDYQGSAYSFEQPLADGHHCWKLDRCKVGAPIRPLRHRKRVASS